MTLKEIGEALNGLPEKIAAQLGKLTTVSAVTPEIFGEVRANYAALKAETELLKSNLAAFEGKHTEASKKITDLEAELVTAKATIADPKGAIQTAAGAKAASIAAEAGIPAISAAAPDLKKESEMNATEKCLAARKNIKQ